MGADIPTDLLSRLQAHIDRDQCVSYDWGEPKFDAGQDCADAIDEIKALRADVAIQAVNAKTVTDLQAEVARLSRPAHEREPPHCSTCSCGHPSLTHIGTARTAEEALGVITDDASADEFSVPRALGLHHEDR